MWRLPWDDRTVSHAVLDFVRGCNVTCRACYNTAPPAMKTLQQVREELDLLMSMRRLHSVAILGGEPTLHPDLPAVVRLVRRRGPRVELFTNGLLVDDAMASSLADAGVDTIALHIERGQQRPDLDAGDLPDVLRLLEEKARVVVRHGMQAGTCLTVDRDSIAELPRAMRAFLESRCLTLCVLTLHIDARRIKWVSGDLRTSLEGALDDAASVDDERGVPLEDVRHVLADALGLTPFAYLGSNIDPDDPRWLSYLVATSVSADGAVQWSPLRSSLVEPVFLEAFRLIGGVYPFHQSASPRKALAHLLANALAGGRTRPGLRMFARSVFRGASTTLKRILIQRPAEIAGDGRVRHCANCPDATVHGGRLVPVCLRDRVVNGDAALGGDREVSCASS
jgi:pyruvate-formate lyase-activating enzyme